LIIEPSKKNLPWKAGLLVYCVAVILLAYAPWNLGLLLVGCCLSRRLDQPHKVHRIHVRAET
jgi:hypothetical protein